MECVFPILARQDEGVQVSIGRAVELEAEHQLDEPAARTGYLGTEYPGLGRPPSTSWWLIKDDSHIHTHTHTHVFLFFFLPSDGQLVSPRRQHLPEKTEYIYI